MGGKRSGCKFFIHFFYQCWERTRKLPGNAVMGEECPGLGFASSLGGKSRTKAMGAQQGITSFRGRKKPRERHSPHGAARCRGQQQAGVKAPGFLGKAQAEMGHQENSAGSWDNLKWGSRGVGNHPPWRSTRLGQPKPQPTSPGVGGHCVLC